MRFFSALVLGGKEEGGRGRVLSIPSEKFVDFGTGLCCGWVDMCCDLRVLLRVGESKRCRLAGVVERSPIASSEP